jgi:signal transduction histidine kinase
MVFRAGLSLRSRFILILLGGAILPLAVIGVWLNQTAERSGERLLRERLNNSLSEVAEDVGLGWLVARGEILRIAELPEIQAGLKQNGLYEDASEGSRPPATGVTDSQQRASLPSSLVDLFAEIRGTVEEMRIRDSGGDVRWTMPTGSGVTPGIPPDAVRPLPIRLGVFDLASGQRLGTLDLDLRLGALLSGTATWGGVAGSLLGAFEPRTGASLLPLPIDPLLLEQGQFQWRDEGWLAVRRELQDPPLELVMAAPVTPFVDPFRASARSNLWILAAVTLVVLALATMLTRGTTRALARLADAAEAVAEGDLDHGVESEGRDEVGRVGRAFNTMTESLRRTLQELSQRRALAAVGEFAAALAHEVRNPLTSIRVDLQRIEEKLPHDRESSELMARTLRKIDALNRSVSGALQVARSGHVSMEPLNLRDPLRAAVQMAEPAYRNQDAHLHADGVEGEPIIVDGDAAALERLFLNLLLNAAQALAPGGSATVLVEVVGDELRVSIKDEGRGIETENLERIFDPFFSTRSDGTGLGLPIALRIAQAHGGKLSTESMKGSGTTVTLHLPRLRSESSKLSSSERHEPDIELQ